MKFTRTKWLSILALLLITFAVLAGCNETVPPAVTDANTDTVAVTDPITVADPETNTETEATAVPNEQTEPVTETPTEVPTEVPSETPTDIPAETPSETLPDAPAEKPTEGSTEEPTEEPTEVPTEEPTEAPTEAPTEPEGGHEVGDPCYDATLPLVGDQGTYTVSDGKGRVVILNFWGNWCPPCKSELPHFDQLADEYEGRVQVVTIHSDYALSGAESYIQTNYPDSKMIFTYDKGDVYYDLLARDNAWPITFVLDEEGIIRNRFRGAVTYKQLKNVLSNLLP